MVRLMDKILHDSKDPKLWELWYIPCNGKCRILSISRSICGSSGFQHKPQVAKRWILKAHNP